MKYLGDASALIRILRKQVDEAWFATVQRGLVSICEPAVAEALLAADARDYTATEAKLEATYPVAVIPDDVGDLTAAIRLKMTVLHEDSDFETIARYVPDLKHRRMSKGPEN
ncbi:hypothetical protein [Actinoplanes derwentensis]|uniref:Predicted nucleic acid-binding protein, contains PIN domain n=1 Tax=Actinoplanes derwentensis TaxID=113562 RepID=A0A1H2DA61_9ACTN|nr:hypothetical protein [Actinoplanes derwentensis]GID81636.1 hypothetical protein Ade03nite_05600 [Actinoplanes derwentensis]SDT79489.1 Predicted nucleic acid-binding protein, contains PIN domain [Actinoplanes derwentensis]